MSKDPHTYEAKIWQHGEVWKANVLRNGISFTLDNEFASHDEALDWAKSRAAEFRAENEAEATAERVTL